MQNEETNSERRHCSWKPLSVHLEVWSLLKSGSFQQNC